MREVEIICIRCPVACRVKLTVNDKNEIIKVVGNECPLGEKYAEGEFKSPTRILTATVVTKSSSQPLLPVRTDKPIPKSMLKKCMIFLSKIRVKPPIKMGQVIIPNILGTDANVVSTDEFFT